MVQQSTQLVVKLIGMGLPFFQQFFVSDGSTKQILGCKFDRHGVVPLLLFLFILVWAPYILSKKVCLSFLQGEKNRKED